MDVFVEPKGISPTNNVCTRRRQMITYRYTRIHTHTPRDGHNKYIIAAMYTLDKPGPRITRRQLVLGIHVY